MPTLNYKSLPTGDKIAADRHEIIAVVGPWGSGKSTIAAYDLYEHCLKYHCDALIVRDTYPALRDSCVKKFMEIFQGAGDLHMGPPPTFKWYGELRNYEVMFRSAEDPEDIQKFGSVEVGYAWLEEVCPGLLPGGAINTGIAPEVLSGVLGRIRKWGRAGGHRRLLCTSLPPPTTRHWFHTLFYDKRPLMKSVSDEIVKQVTDQLSLYKLPAVENLPNLPPGYYETQMTFLTSEDQIARFIKGEVGSGYGPAAIYNEQWNDQVHIANIEPIKGPMIMGIDGGLDATAVWLQIQPSGRLFVLDELSTHGLGLEDFGLAAQQRGNQMFGPRHYDYWADPAIFSRSQNDAKDGAWYLRQVGVTCRPAPQDPKVRIGAVRTWLSRMSSMGPLFQINPRCELLIEGFRGAYHWKLANGQPIIGTIDKNEFSHPHDALQYPLAALLHKGEKGKPLPPLPISKIDFLGRTVPARTGRSAFTRRNPELRKG